MAIDTKEIGERIKKLRKDRGWNQTDFASQAGIDQSSLNKYESGKQCPHLETLVIIASTLHTSLDYLVFGVNEGKVTIESGEKNEEKFYAERILESLAYLIGRKCIYFKKNGNKYLNVFDYKTSPAMMEFIAKLMKLQKVWDDPYDNTYQENVDKLIQQYVPKIATEDNRSKNWMTDMGYQDDHAEAEENRVEAAKESLGD